MTKRATLDGKKLLVKDSCIRGAPLPDSDSEEDEEDAQSEEAVDAADKDTSGAGASAEPPPVPKRVRKPNSRMEAAPCRGSPSGQQWQGTQEARLGPSIAVVVQKSDTRIHAFACILGVLLHVFAMYCMPV